MVGFKSHPVEKTSKSRILDEREIHFGSLVENLSYVKRSVCLYFYSIHVVKQSHVLCLTEQGKSRWIRQTDRDSSLVQSTKSRPLYEELQYMKNKVEFCHLTYHHCEKHLRAINKMCGTSHFSFDHQISPRHIVNENHYRQSVVITLSNGALFTSHSLFYDPYYLSHRSFPHQYRDEKTMKSQSKSPRSVI